MKLEPFLLTFVLGIAAASAPAAAQESVPPEETFREEIEVSVVNLEVFVTDKKGQPVTDLRREDFEVLEDGKPVEITNFFAEQGAPAAPAAPASLAADTPDTPAAVRALDQRLSLVVFVDDVNLEPQNRNRILGRVREFLPAHLGPGDQVMVVRFHGSLEVVRPFTSDVPQVSADLTGLEALSGDLRRREETRDTATFQAAEAAEAMGGWEAVESIIKQYAATESAFVRSALEALDQVVGWIASLPGRKAILYVSDGIPAVPGEDMYLWASTRSGYRAGRRVSMLDSQGFDATKRFREVTSRASRSRVAFYPIETMGAHVERGATLQEHRIANRQNGLRILAEETGGLAMLNAADPGKALAKMAADLSSYYSLGYRPQRVADDREHKIEVNVQRKGAVVRHRRWYKDKPTAEAVAERTTAAMVFGAEENPLGATLEIGDQTPATPERTSFVVPVRVKVPIEKLFLEAKGTGREGRLRLFVVATGEGKLTPVRETRVITVQVPESDMAAGKAREYVHEVRITLERGSYTLGVGVRDEIATTTSYLQGKIEAGGTAAGR
jgi:VWFA-related protein